MDSITLDIRAELAAVQSAISHARQTQSRITSQITATANIEVLSQLHDRWAEATEELAQAERRRRELVAALSQ